MAEKRLLSSLLDSRNIFNIVSKHKGKDDFSDIANIIYDTAKGYYDRDPEALRVDRGDLRTIIQMERPRQYERIDRLLDHLPEVSAPNVAKLWIDFKIESIKTRITEELLSGKDASSLMKEYQELVSTSVDDVFSCDDDENEIYIGTPLDKIFTYYSKDNLCPLFPSSLNEVMDGGVPDGTHILVYATPETGKTAFAVNQACGLARLGHKVLYIGNEDPGAAILTRMLSNLVGADRSSIMENQEKAYEHAVSKGYNNIVFASLTPGNFTILEELINEHSPKMVIIDQLHNLLLGKTLSKVEELFHQTTLTREIGKRTGTTIMSFTQADEKAIGKRVLGIENVYYSNIGVQQATDIMIGIGMSSEDARTNTRYLSLTKNKHTGSREPIRVRIEPRLSRFMS